MANDTQQADRKSLGFMYLAKYPCGRVVAMSWDDKGREKDTAKRVAEWIKRGDKVERVERFEDDLMPEWICDECRGKECKDSA
jgi:hypothetical protein